MKFPQLVSQRRQRNHGVALIIVLAMLVLLSGIVVAFMTSATTERAASAANSGVTSARQIADSTVSFVISQIRDATSVADEKTTWASQPGAIRTFAGALSPGNKQKGTPPLPSGAYWDDYSPDPTDAVYKLYSSDVMKIPSRSYTNDDVNKNGSLDNDNKAVVSWDALDSSKNATAFPDHVDLNAPILSTRFDLAPDGTVVEPRYPIIDPRAKLDKTGALQGANPGIVDGFDANFTSHKSQKLVGLDGKKSSVALPLLPMPVKWLYLFRDGTIGPASLGTVKNPIVGRTAFWTDDESCKLNINTASEGTFWDTPTVSTMQEMGNWQKDGVIPAVDRGLNLATSQPNKGEYQRYPGHPATTCLSPALGWLWDISNNGAAATPIGPYVSGNVNTVYNKFKQAIYRLSPYTPFGLGTSQDATHNSDWEADADGKLRIDTKHLYASIDEMMFQSDRFTVVGGTTTPNLNVLDPTVPASTITPEALERVRFFLTANSRAPELNLFSRPRVTVWPVNALAKYRTSFDDVFIFTSTLAKASAGTTDNRYCFLRGDAKSPTNDFNGIDGRNGQLFTFLQTMTSKPIPGFGKSFDSTSKWGPEERDEILTLIMDYLRSVNLVDTGTTTRVGDVFAPYTPKFFYATPPANQYARYERSYDWSGQVTPLRKTDLDKYQGLGRFITPTEVAIVFSGNAPVPPGSPAGSKFMRATLFIEMTTPMAGYPGIRETYWTKVVPKRKTTVQLTGAAAAIDTNFCGDVKSLTGLINICNIGSHEVAQGRSFMPTLGFSAAMYRFPEHKGPTLLGATALEKPNTDPNRNPSMTVLPKNLDNSKPASVTPLRGDANTVLYYPYVSDSIPIGTATTFTLNAGAYDIQIYVGEAPDDPRSKLVQTVHIDFPADAVTNLRIPTSGDMAVRLSGGDTIETPNQFVDANDTVRSMELTCGNSQPFSDGRAGDVRLAAALSDVPKYYFAPKEGLAAYKTNAPIQHGLTRGHGDPDRNNTGFGLFVAGSTVRGGKPPILPKFVQGVLRADGGPGDWDRGLSKHNDGAMGNKVDEGNIKYDYSSGATDHTVKPYYRGRGIEETGQAFFTPNRQMPSAVMFGSLPTGVVGKKPWQTLLFRPNREVALTHPGADTTQGPPDHLLLDLFHMPVVEPYAISEPFSTAGKVNMNYVLAPFGYTKGPNNSGFTGTHPDTASPRTYIRRDTALRGVLKSVYMMAVPNTMTEGAHREDIENELTPTRFPIDPNRTLEEFERRLQHKPGEYPLFRSASEICSIDLYPRNLSNAAAPVVGTGDSGWDAFWKANGLTGDNMRERPYAHIYPRLTTKSNVYTVHFRCQSIRKSPNSKPDEFNLKSDAVVGDYRGSATIERFVDPNDAELTKYKENNQKVDPLYRYRVVNTKHFAPK